MLYDYIADFTHNAKWELIFNAALAVLAVIIKARTGKEMTVKHILKFWIACCLCGTIATSVAHTGVIKPIIDQLSYEKAIPPQLQSEITFLSVEKAQRNSPPSIVTLLVKMVNGGGPSVAWKWHLHVQPDFGQALDTEASPLPTIPISTALIENQGIPLDANHYLPNILLENSLSTGSGKVGWVQFPFDNISVEDLTRYGTTFTLEFQDAARKKITTTYRISGKVGSSEFVFNNALATNFPGFRSEFPLPFENLTSIITILTCTVAPSVINITNNSYNPSH